MLNLTMKRNRCRAFGSFLKAVSFFKKTEQEAHRHGSAVGGGGFLAAQDWKSSTVGGLELTKRQTAGYALITAERRA
jgi:hypothetical protein